jgi:hypothetical protein
LREKILIILLFGLFQMNGNSQDALVKSKTLGLEFSVKGGFYNDYVILELRSPGARIYYTTNGSKPTRRSKVYDKPIVVKSTTAIRAIARKGRRKSNIKGHTFFIGEEPSTFPVVSMLVPPQILFDEENGLFIEGPDADSSYAKFGANFWSKKEVKINCEIFETDGTCVYRSNSGFRLFGGMSRLFPQKSIVLVARDKYGKKRIKHKIFGKGTPKKHKYLVLRNSGSDWGKAHLRDKFMTSLVDDWDIEVQDSRPSHVYINGKYWGIYNIREKVNRFYLQEHTDVDKDSLDLMEHRMNRKRGSAIHYQKMLKFMKENDLSDPTSYAYLNSLMEVENFIDYKVAQIFFDNQDAGGNIKYWRPQTPTGKWRWILYDTDWGFGLHDERAYRNNSLAFHTKENGPAWPNPEWSTFILRKLLENKEFEEKFINRFCDALNTSFENNNVEAKLDEHINMLSPEIDKHLKRWKLSRKKWEYELKVMKKFGKERPNFTRMHLMEKFNTGAIVNLEIESQIGGYVVLNGNVKIDNSVFEGKYFERIPVALRAVPNFGYRFSRWEGLSFKNVDHELIVSLEKRKRTILKAVFEKYEHPLANQIMINEISSNNKKTGDWVEIYNSSEEIVNVNDWIFADSKNGFTLPNVNLEPKSYLILCEDSLAFRKNFPDYSMPIVGNLGFGIKKKKEQLGLYTDGGASVDSTAYHIVPLDSIFTMSLLLPHLDNSDMENWEIIRGNGTPSKENPFYLQSLIKAQQDLYLRIGVAIGILLSCFIVLSFRRRKELKRTA